MKIDDINNSQMILLVILISLVVGTAAAISTISLVYERIEGVGKQTIVKQQTINRIIERKIPIIVEQKEEKLPALTIEDINKTMVDIYFGSSQVTTGVFVSESGIIITPDNLSTKRKYSTFQNDKLVILQIKETDSIYSLLKPVEPFNTQNYLNVGSEELSLGNQVLLMGGKDENINIYDGIISQKGIVNNNLSIKTSISSNSVSIPSLLIINEKLYGFVVDRSLWIKIIDFKNL